VAKLGYPASWGKEYTCLGTLHKRLPKSWGFVQCGHFSDKGVSSDADVRTIWCKKTLDFSKFMVCPHGQGGRGVKPVRTFFGQGERGVNFSRFWKDVFYGRPLMLSHLKYRIYFKGLKVLTYNIDNTLCTFEKHTSVWE